MNFPGTTNGDLEILVGVQRQVAEMAAGPCDVSEGIDFDDFSLTVTQ
jgi:hypothetical protein